MPPIELELYYDCLSPYSYLAFTVLARYQKVWSNTELVLKPFLLAGVMATVENMPPGARPWAAATAKVALQDLERNREWFNVPQMLGVPANFFGPDGPSDSRGLARDFRYQRTLAALRHLHPEVLQEATRLVFEQIWADSDARDAAGNVAMDEAVLESICVKAGLSREQAKHCVGQLGSNETKGVLKSTVAEAVGRGSYGAPTIIVSGAPGRDEMIFFGSDRFEQLAFVSGLPWYGPDPARPTAAKL